ncbi:MAG: response regulator transcription factor [Coriobacteriales bacterium]|nr:response regulator transcription factor [Coriobacteriales bacterium]
MSKILLVEDDAKIARFVELELKHEGYEVTKAADGQTGATLALAEDYDLVLLDLMLPVLSGMEALRRIRRAKDVPVIVLTARDAVMDKVAGLDAGADDYVTKPFAIEELLARIRTALKHRESTDARQPEEPHDTVLNAHGVYLNVDRHEVTAQGEAIALTQREFEVLRALMEHKNHVLSRDQLAQLALGYDYAGTSNVVDVHVRHLRAKIDDRFGTKLISTVRGVGYVIREV